MESESERPAGAPDLVVVDLDHDPDVDAEVAERLGRLLRTELQELEVDSVTFAQSGRAPHGSKGDAVAWTELLISLNAAGGVLPVLIATIRDWLGRQRQRTRISLKIDNDILELDAASAAERSALIDAFIKRHGG